MAELIVYPDAHPESTSMDGYINVEYKPGHGVSWATLVAESGISGFLGVNPGVYPRDTQVSIFVTITANDEAGLWKVLSRALLLFDTSAIPNDDIVVTATLSLYGSGKADNLNIVPDVNVYSSNPDSNTGLTGTDFATLGSTPFCNTPITYVNWDTDGWNDFILNATGIAAISKTGITKLGLRNANYDVAGVTPAWSDTLNSYFSFVSADTAGDPTRIPKLTINHTDVVADTMRISSLVHRWVPGSYTLECIGGGLSSEFGLVIPSGKPAPTIPELPSCPPGYILSWSLDRGYFCIKETDIPPGKY